MTIEGMNETSQVSIPGGPLSIILIEILEDGILIEVPHRSCADGHTLSLTVTTHRPGAESKMQIVGVISQVETVSKSRQQVILHFRKIEKTEWEALLTYLNGKQEVVNQLIERARK